MLVVIILLYKMNFSYIIIYNENSHYLRAFFNFFLYTNSGIIIIIPSEFYFFTLTELPSVPVNLTILLHTANELRFSILVYCYDYFGGFQAKFNLCYFF